MSWFQRQLEMAAKEAAKLPDWARREAGLKPLSRPRVKPLAGIRGLSELRRVNARGRCPYCGRWLSGGVHCHNPACQEKEALEADEARREFTEEKP